MKHSSVFGVICLLLATASCSLPLSAARDARFHIQLNGLGRYVSPDSVAFRLLGSGPNASSLSADLTPGSNRIAGLVPGSWDLTVLGKAADGSLVQEGATTATLAPGDNGSVVIVLGVPIQVTVGVETATYPLTLTVEQLGTPVTPTVTFYLVNGSKFSTVSIHATDGFDSYRWLVDGVLQTSTTNTLSNIWSDDPMGNNTAIHHVVVVVQKGSVVESFEIFVQSQRALS